MYFLHSSFYKNYETISLQSKFLRMFSCKQGQTSGSNIAKKMFWWNSFCSNFKDCYKINCSNEIFRNNFGQDGICLVTDFLTKNAPNFSPQFLEPSSVNPKKSCKIPTKCPANFRGFEKGLAEGGWRPTAPKIQQKLSPRVVFSYS